MDGAQVFVMIDDRYFSFIMKRSVKQAEIMKSRRKREGDGEP